MPIIVSSNGKNAKKIDKTIIEKEDYLQAYIYENPECIPIFDIKENTKLVIVAREYPTESGPIDALGIDADGDIYVIETKLYKNPDKRLVVAQVLDYGASLWSTYTDYSDFFSLVEREITKSFGISANQKFMEDFELAEDELNILYDKIRANLADGNYKFVVLMDHLHQRLKDLIIYLNQNSQFDIYAVEVEYYNYDKLEIVIPKLYGAEVRKDKSISPRGVKIPWDENRFFSEANSSLKVEEIAAIKILFHYTQNITTNIRWSSRYGKGTCNPKFPSLNERCPYSIRTDGKLDLHFDVLVDDDEMRSKRANFVEMLSKIYELSIAKNDPWKVIPISAWMHHVDEIIDIIGMTLL